jgi:hypothetical protein
MKIPLPRHLSIHFFSSLFVGVIGSFFGGNLLLNVAASLAGGFFIDLDHVLEYFLVYKRFDLKGFFKGKQFLESGRTRLYFHGWEYILPGIIIIYWLKSFPLFFFATLCFVLAAVVHLISDCYINSCPWRFYSFLYRRNLGFWTKNLSSEEKYQEFLKERKELLFD